MPTKLTAQEVLSKLLEDSLAKNPILRAKQLHLLQKLSEDLKSQPPSDSPPSDSNETRIMSTLKKSRSAQNVTLIDPESPLFRSLDRLRAKLLPEEWDAMMSEMKFTPAPARKERVEKRLLYRVVPHNGGVVFAKPERAILIAKIHAAIHSSKTWGQFRSAMPRKAYSDIVRAFDDNGEPRPKSTDPFSGESLPGWSDGDYPPWLQPEMDYILPASVLEQFGQRKTTFLNGNFWLIPESSLAAICAALEALGWEVERAQNLQFH